jgi:hypothetical protein
MTPPEHEPEADGTVVEVRQERPEPGQIGGKIRTIGERGRVNGSAYQQRIFVDRTRERPESGRRRGKIQRIFGWQIKSLDDQIFHQSLNN